MKIGITCYPTYGGSGAMATELGKELALKGHEVHIISYAIPFRLESFTERVFYHEVEMFDYPLFDYYPYSLSLGVKMAEVIQFNKLDLLHVHYAIPHSISAFLAKQISEEKKFKFVSTLHGTDVTIVGSHPSFKPITRFALNISDGVTAVSESLRKDIINCIEVNNDIKVIYNFVDTKVFSNRNRGKYRSCFAPGDEKLVCHMSNFRPVKRVEKVLKVFQNVLNSGICAKLLLVGDGPERAKMENECRELGICDKTMFLGKKEAVHEILRCCDLFLLPSDTESFGLAALEAMACEVPVIATRVGGLPELVDDGKSGYLFEKKDIKGMSDAAISILSDDNLRKKLGLAGVRLARSEFNKDKIISQYENYYEEILRKP